MRIVIERVLAGEAVTTWGDALMGTLKHARESAECFGVTQRHMEQAWRKHRQRQQLRNENKSHVPINQRWRCTQLSRAYNDCDYRRATHEHDVKMNFGEPGASSGTAKLRPSAVGLPNAYSTRGYWVASSEHTICAHEGWLQRVKLRGASVVDGMLTLDLAPAAEPGTQAYAAVWVERGRGTAIRAVRGWLVREEWGWRHVRGLKGLRRAA